MLLDGTCRKVVEVVSDVSSVFTVKIPPLLRGFLKQQIPKTLLTLTTVVIMFRHGIPSVLLL